MKELSGMMFLVVFLVLFLFSSAEADDKTKGPSCQDQLNEKTVQAYNLDKDRDAKEQSLAKVQATNIALAQRVQMLEKQIEAMKKAAEPPKADEKKAE